MKEIVQGLPIWFLMLLITAITGTVICILIKADRIKAGPIEIEDRDNKDEVQK